MGDQNNEAEDQHASREQERDRKQWNDVAARLERLRPLCDQFASEIAKESAAQDRIVEFFQNAQTADDTLRKLSELGGYAQSDLIAAAIRVQRVTALRVADLERAIADLRAAQPADPTGAHPYRSGQRTASRCPTGGAPARPSTTGRPASRPGALRRVYGALAFVGACLPSARTMVRGVAGTAVVALALVAWVACVVSGAAHEMERDRACERSLP